MMKTSTLRLFGVDALKSLKRNRTLSTVSVATVAATLFILGMFLLVIFNVKSGVNEVESQIQVQVYLKDNISIEQQNAVLNKITNISGVNNVQFESKDEAFAKFKKQIGSKNKSLIEGMDSNSTMPNSYIISIAKPDYSAKVVKALENSSGNPIDGIDKISDGRETVNKIIAVTKTIQWIGVVILVILVGVSLFLIGNTIKLAVYSRRREIGIMKYIGATDWFIRLPFVIEGMIIGIIGAIIAVIIVFYIYKLFYSRISSSFMMTSLIPTSYIWSTMLWAFLVVGMLIGALGSILSIRKFLEV